MTDASPIEELAKPEQQNFVAFFRKLDEPGEGTIRLFEREANQRKYYTVHGDSAQYVAEHVFKTRTVVKYWGDGLPTTTLSSNAAEGFLRDALLNKQQRIEVWIPKRGGQWELNRKASPGNLQDVEDFLFVDTNMTVSPVVMAAWIAASGDSKTVGVSFADASSKEIGVCQFIDNEIYSNFESLVIQLGVKECIMVENPARKDYDVTKATGVLERCGVVVTERKRADFNTKDIEQDLNRLLQGDISIAARPEFDMKSAMSACACLIRYLSLLSDETNFKQYQLQHHDLSQYMRLDASALTALNLMPSPREGSNKTMSLYGLLNKCKTAQGSRLLMQWLKQPLLSLGEIGKRHDLVEMFYGGTELRQSLHNDHLKYVPDLHRLAKRFQRGIASLQDVVRIHQVILRLPAIILCLESNKPENEEQASLLYETYTANIRKYAENLTDLGQFIEDHIDLDAVDNHEFRINPASDPQLQKLRSDMDRVRDGMDNVHMEVGHELGLDIEKKLKLEKHSTYGYCLRVSRTDASKLRNKSRYMELSTQKSGTFFTTNALQNLNTQWSDASSEYDRCQARLVKDVIEKVAHYHTTFELLGGVLAHMDVLLSFAFVSIMAPAPYIRPQMQMSGDVVLQDARHPCLEMQDDVEFIANDVSMQKGNSEFQIITGPNMGGKSTYIRQIGVIALMAQIGCFVPCSEAHLRIFDCILARVGAGDSQLRGVSTFMAEMLETATILKTATSNSLIIIDELGRGTSTYDGFGLAWAISEYIATRIRAFTLFATHFHELTDLGKTVSHVKNLNVAVDIRQNPTGGNSITLLYKVTEGICDQSFGIHVAEMANFPQNVVNLAKRKASELEDRPEDEVAKKHPKQDVEDGEKLLQHVAQELANVEEPLQDNIQSVAAKYKSQVNSNPYLKELLDL
ncbi:dna mismatch repair protein [Lichtheimia corymbifera JMRC:FSU:9682]|uniref:DNA mismatch repair protein MSH2 n=1 Tax=Lichtheimia corymbifera JMRC:FSU:9682 TaxID=1263082 RepID=A0A068RHV5_9FUNG|nr:dna mismatch repair protein [Lichtheimia corymbifera JMRC:FSU:9682]